MSLTEHAIISKAIDNNQFYLLDKYNLSSADFVAIPDVYEFVRKHVRQYGQCPDYRTVVAECADFQYKEDVADNIAYMAKKLKSDTAKRKMYELFSKEVQDNFSRMTGTQFANWLAEKSTEIADEANSASTAGTNLAVNGAERKQLYLDSKERGTGKYIPTPYPTLTGWLGGGFELGDYVLLLAYTNKGKSWIATDIGEEAWRNGYGVIDYRPEISKAQMLNRWDTLAGKFNNVQLKLGKLSESDEQRYFDYLDKFNEKQEVPYILKTMDDMPDGLSVKAIAADIEQHPECSMVIIDGFNLMDHHGTGREAMTATSRQLRQLFGRKEVVGIVVHQTPTAAEKDGKITSAEDDRMVKAPELTDYSETVATIQDAYTVLTFNQIDGIGNVKLAKSKTPSVGKELELVCDFNRGIIREPELIDNI